MPSEEAADAALNLLSAIVPYRDSIEAKRYPGIRFVDQGGNFERIQCPSCRSEIPSSQWRDWMDESHLTGFSSRSVVLVCCGSESDLNDLIYQGPAGFSRFVLEIMNPNPAHWLSREDEVRIGNALGCRIRQILAHY